MKLSGSTTMLALACLVSSPVQGQATRLSPDDFRSRFNIELSSHGLRMKLGSWKADSPRSVALSALVTPDIRVIGQRDQEGRLSSVLFVMQIAKTLESLGQVLATVAATTYAANPELSQQDRELLFRELGFFDEGWAVRGLDGIAVRHGITYRVLHPGSDTLITALVSWNAEDHPDSLAL